MGKGAGLQRAIDRAGLRILSLRRRFGGTSLRRELMLVFLACGMSGWLLATYFRTEYELLNALAQRVEQAGQLRMLSQRALLQARALAAGDPAAGPGLSSTRVQFERVMTILRRSRTSSENHEAREGLDRIATHWAVLNHSLDELIRAGARGRPAAHDAQLVDAHADLTLAAAEANVQRLLPAFERAQRRVAWLPPITMVSGLALVIAMYFYIRQRLLTPVAGLDRMLARVGAGDLAARAEVRRHDEMGALLARANRAAQALERARAQEAAALAQLRDSEVRHRTLWEIAADAIVVIDLDGTILFASPSVATVFGHAPEDLVGRPIEVLQPVALRAAHRDGFRRHLRSGARRVDWSSVEVPALHRDGRVIEVELSFSRMRLSEADWFVGTFRDITQRKQAQEQLRLTHRAIAASSEGIAILDARAEGHPVLYANPAISAMTGQPIDEILGRPGRILLDEAGADGAEPEALRRLIDSGKAGTVTLRTRRRDGSHFWNELSIAPVSEGNDEVTHFIAVSKDVTERRRQEEALVHSATYDALTGLPNRVLLHDRVDQSIAAARRHRRSFAVMYVDIDNFKIVNDSLGHEAGDLLLREAAARLLGCVREGDTVARVGGDEFVVLLGEPVDEGVVDMVARRLLAAFGKVFRIDESEAFAGASIGVAVFPRDGETRVELLQHADIAMFRAKEQGRNNYQLYAQQMQRRYQERLSLESQLRRAVDNEELVLHYQPQVEIASGRVLGAEALVRWESPGLGRVSPAQFVPLAEETGLIVPIGEWIIRQAAADARAWSTRPGGEGCRVSVNLSARQFAGDALRETVAGALRDHGLDGDRVELEVTESLVMRNPKQASELLNALRGMGCKVAIDDFGTGYSSLSYLRHFPLDTLKIDRSLVGDAAIVRAVIQLARSFGLRIVAEGVEDEATVLQLSEAGCDVIQGYFFAQPLAFDALLAYLAAPTAAATGAALAPMGAPAARG